jgi:hypothetical protein
MLAVMTASLASHRWTTTSSHLTSDGWVRYQRCLCGRTRILVNAEPIGVTAPSLAGDPGRDGTRYPAQRPGAN